MLKVPAIETDPHSGVEILGTPTEVGNTDFTLYAKDGSGKFAGSQNYILTVTACRMRRIPITLGVTRNEELE
jgi:hypothetical protein